MKRAGRYWVPDEEQIQLEALAAGGWQLDHLEEALSLVPKKRRVAVDGGAHIGSWTMRLAEVFDTVHAFEPCKPTYECLYENMKEWRREHLDLSTHIHLHRFALGETKGLMGMGEDARYSDGGNTGGRYLKPAPDGDISVRPLDSFKLGHVDFVKLDVEGFELFALKGARETLLRSKPIVLIEVKLRMAARFGLAQNDAGDYLESLGFVHRGNRGADHFYGWGKGK